MVSKKLNWSSYQKDIFKNISKGTGNTIIIARAGASKTTSLVEGCRYVPKGNKILFCAFNKSIQEELKARLPSYVECLTLHSLGYRAVRQRFGSVELNNRKTWDIINELYGYDKENYDLYDNFTKAVSLCKSTLTDVPSKIEELVLEYNIDTCDLSLEDFAKNIVKILRACKEKTNVIDFDDMVWFPFIFRLNVGSYQYVFVDEAHDMSASQIELALSAVSPNGRIITVLDPNQAIYAFRGADSRVLDNLRNRLNPVELSLPICYRCPKKVIEEAKKIVPDIQAFENAIEGEVNTILIHDLMKLAKPGSYVISRFNAPLVKHCMKFLKSGVPANILGRDIGGNLTSLIKRSKKKNVRDFLKWLNNWEKNEKEKLLDRYPSANVDGIQDKAECLRNLCEDSTTIDEVRSNIDKLFKDNDEKKIVLFSSIHRIKGKECDDVFVLADTLRSFDQVEININYVSKTRAKKRLFMVYNKMPVGEI
jgi:superfamily I DNA/RNA helicase